MNLGDALSFLTHVIRLIRNRDATLGMVACDRAPLKVVVIQGLGMVLVINILIVLRESDSCLMRRGVLGGRFCLDRRSV